VGFDKKAVGSLWTPHPGHTATPPLRGEESILNHFPYLRFSEKYLDIQKNNVIFVPKYGTD
jgi:hypothetical protein